jgi:lysophospholipase L1-like esterase
MRKPLYWMKLAGINLLVFAMLIFTLEVVLRLTLPKLHSCNTDENLLQDHRFGKTYGLKPNARGYSFDALVITNQQGFRIDPAWHPSFKEKTLLVMGDSLTMGVGVSAGESFPERLNRRFTAFKITNAAVVGYQLSDYLEVLEKVLPEVRPAGIILGLCLNDPDSLSKEEFAAALRRGKVTIADYKSRYPNPLWRTIRYLNDRYLDFNAIGNEYLRSYVWAKELFADTSKIYYFVDTAIYSKPETYIQVCAGFRQLRSLVQKNNAWLEIFIFPYEYQLRPEGQEMRQPQDLLLKAARAEGVSALDLTSPLQQYLVSKDLSSRRLFLYKDCMHFSPEGHRVIADLIYKELTSRNLAY